jgi:uncharacterized membrane protein YccC
VSEFRETEVKRDAKGRLIGRRECTHKRSPAARDGGFGRGFLIGALIVMLGLIYFAYQRGSFERAGADADRMAARAEAQTREAASEARRTVGQAAERTGESLQRAGEEAQRPAPAPANRTRN